MSLSLILRILVGTAVLAAASAGLFAQSAPAMLLDPKKAVQNECIPRGPRDTATLRVLVVAPGSMEFPEASVALRSPDNVEETQSTDADGIATFPWFPNRAYEVGAEYPAFVPVHVRPLNARLGCTTEIRIELQVSAKECDDSGLPCL